MVGADACHLGQDDARILEPEHLAGGLIDDLLAREHDEMVNDYLICLGALARTLRSKETRDALLTASTPAEFIARLRKRN